MISRLPLPILPPREIYAVLLAHADGATPTEIGARYELTRAEVQRYLQPRPSTTMPTPFDLRGGSAADVLPIPFYWLGFVVASGWVHHRRPPSTLILPIQPDDAEFVTLLITDLFRTHPSYEFCHSSHHGNQLYIRNHDLGEALLHWGVDATPGPRNLPVEFIPDAGLAHFARGLLEGQWKRGNGSDALLPARPTQVTFTGGAEFLTAFGDRLGTASGVRPSAFAADDAGAAKLVFRQAAAQAVLRSLYAHPVRSTPRARKLAATHSRAGALR